MNHHVLFLLLFLFVFCGNGFSQVPNPRTETKGYIQFLYTHKDTEPHSGGIEIQRVRVEFEGETPEFLYHVEFDPQDTPVLDEVFVQFTLTDAWKVQLGRFRIPFGHETQIGTSEFLFINRATVFDQAFGDRETGVSAAYNTNYISFENGLFQKNEGGVRETDLIGRTGFSLPDYDLETGFSYYAEDVKTDTTHFTILRGGFDFTFKILDLEVTPELVVGKGSSQNRNSELAGYKIAGEYPMTAFGKPLSAVYRFDYFQDGIKKKLSDYYRHTFGLALFTTKSQRWIGQTEIERDIAGKWSNGLILHYQLVF